MTGIPKTSSEEQLALFQIILIHSFQHFFQDIVIG